MGLNINGSLFQLENNGISITSNSIKGLSFDSTYNIPIESNRPCFVAGRSNSGWTNFTPANWNTMVFDTTAINIDGCYNTSNGRFTAPQTGVYWFEYSLYVQKYTDTTKSGYTHPIFIINGSSTTRHASSSTSYRLRSRTYYSSSYTSDLQINDIFRLTAGDYVNAYVYSSTNLRYNSAYSLFTGFMIG